MLWCWRQIDTMPLKCPQARLVPSGDMEREVSGEEEGWFGRCWVGL